MPRSKARAKTASSISEILTAQGLPHKYSDSTGEYKGKCPFRENHEDGSGRVSFNANPEKNTYHCFSCHEKGTLLNLLIRRFKVPVFDAMDLVTMFDGEPKGEKQLEKLDEMWSLTPPKYLQKRFEPSTLRHFKAGSMIDGPKTIAVLPFYKDNELLAIQYRDLLYTGGKQVDFKPKGFEKGNYLYNYRKPKNSRDFVIVSEGQLDVWRWHEAKLNCASPLGTNLSDRQIELLAEYHTVYLCQDPDLPGVKSAEVTYRKLIKHSVKVKFIPLEKDPGKCTVEELKEAFENAYDYFDFSLDAENRFEHYYTDFVAGLTKKHKVPF